MDGSGKALTNGACLAVGASLSLAGAPLVGATIAAVGAYRASRDGINPVKAVGAFAWDAISGLKGLLDAEKGMVLQPINAVAGALADQAQNKLIGFEFNTEQQQELGTDWLADLADRGNVGVLGDQGEGKSYILRYLAYRFVEQHRGQCRIYIHDIEDGQGHGAKHSWFGWPHGSIVFTRPDDLPQIIGAIEQAIDEPDFLPTLLLVDEFNNVLDELDTEAIALIDRGLKRIRNRGKKRNVHFAFGTQDINVADFGLNRAAIKRLSWIVLPKMAGSPGNFANLDLSDEAKTERRAAYAQLKALDPTEGIYPALLWHDRHWSLRGIPDLTWLPDVIDLTTGEAVTDGPSWVDEFLAQHPDFDPSRYTSASKLTDAINAVLRGEGVPLVKRLKTDERYQSIRQFWDGGRGVATEPATEN